MVGSGPLSNIASATPSAPHPIRPLPPPSSPVTAPGAPTSLTATAGNTEVSLSWTAPSDNGGSTITDYVVEYRTNDLWGTFDDGVSPTTSATITGLTNGVAYEFRVSAVSLAGVGPASTIGSAMPVNTITVGVIVPITGSLESVGKPIDKTIRYAVDKFNQYLADQDRDWRLATSAYDDGSSAAGASDAMLKLNRAGIKSVIGPASSAALASVEEYIGDHGMLAISYGSTAPTLAKEDQIFRTVPNDAFTARVFAQILQDDDVSEVVLVYRDDAWGQALDDVMVRSLQGTGIVVRDNISYSADVLDYGHIVPVIEKSLVPGKQTGIITFGFTEIRHIIDSAAPKDKFQDTRWYAVELAREQLLQDDTRKKFLTDVGFTTVTASFPENNTNAEISRNIEDANVYSYAAHDAVFILGMAIDATGTATDTNALAAAIPGIASIYRGAIGNATLDGAGDLEHSTYEVRTLREGMDDRVTKCGPAKVTGAVFFDVNANGVRDAGERGIGTLTVFADEHHVATDHDGTYTVACLAEEEHTVRIQALPSGWGLPDENTNSVKVITLAGQDNTVSFGLVPTQHDLVTPGTSEFDDTNMHGARDKG